MKSPADVEARIGDPALVEQRRAEIVRAAVRLFSEHGYYVTTIQQIARAAGISVGLVYQYFRDKDDILFLALTSVLETYEREIPRALAGVTHPLARLRAAFAAYCAVIDRLREATVLTYRSTKSLRPERRRYIMAGERRTNRLLEACVADCVRAGYLRRVNVPLLVYQYVLFAHAWALKSWAWRRRYTLRRYVREGQALLIDPFLTPKGRRVR
ncbi:MAG: TetR/AcrR family transcriptional regulator [Gammaproteobacteria bacterium]|nr:TetR/AcrR family transcriptional regulator [Gammaproteobacteria bacterium]